MPAADSTQKEVGVLAAVIAVEWVPDSRMDVTGIRWAGRLELEVVCSRSMRPDSR